MCISLPAKIVAVKGNAATVEIGCQQRTVLLMFAGAAIGDWVLMYSGAALRKLESFDCVDFLKSQPPK